MSAECPICHLTFRTRRKLKKHYRRVHRETLPISRGIFGVEGVKGKRIIDEKQKYSSTLTFSDRAKRQVALGNAVTFGKTSEQFTNLQDAIYEIAKTSSYGSHGQVFITPDIYDFEDKIDLLNYVDLICPSGRAYFYSDTYNFRIPGDNNPISNVFNGLGVYPFTPPAVRIDTPTNSVGLSIFNSKVDGISAIDTSEAFPLYVFCVKSKIGGDIKYECTTGGALHVNLLHSFIDRSCIQSAYYLRINSLQSQFDDSYVKSTGSYGFKLFFYNNFFTYPWPEQFPIGLTPGTHSIVHLYNSIVIGDTHTIGRIGAGNVDAYTAHNKLNVGYSAGVVEHISPTQNIIDTDFEQARQFIGFQFHYPSF